MLRILVILSGVVSLAGVLLLGLPGGLIYQAFLALVPGTAFQAIKPDAAWPIALLVSILCPWGLPLAYFVARQSSSGSKKGWILIFLEVVWLFVICFLLSLIPE